MDFSKIKDSKVLKWTLIIALPTVLVAGYYGYKYLKDKKLDKGEKEKTKEEETEKLNIDGVESESELEFHKTKKIFDVGVNGWDYKPVSYNKLIELSESRLKFNHH